MNNMLEEYQKLIEGKEIGTLGYEELRELLSKEIEFSTKLKDAFDEAKKSINGNNFNFKTIISDYNNLSSDNRELISSLENLINIKVTQCDFNRRLLFIVNLGINECQETKKYLDEKSSILGGFSDSSTEDIAVDPTIKKLIDYTKLESSTLQRRIDANNSKLDNLTAEATKLEELISVYKSGGIVPTIAEDLPLYNEMVKPLPEQGFAETNENIEEHVAEEVNPLPDQGFAETNENIEEHVAEEVNPLPEQGFAETNENVEEHVAEEVNPLPDQGFAETNENIEEHVAEEVNPLPDQGFAETNENVEEHVTEEANPLPDQGFAETNENIEEHVTEEVNPLPDQGFAETNENIEEHVTEEVNPLPEQGFAETNENVEEHVTEEVNPLPDQGFAETNENVKNEMVEEIQASVENPKPSLLEKINEINTEASSFLKGENAELSDLKQTSMSKSIEETIDKSLNLSQQPIESEELNKAIKDYDWASLFADSTNDNSPRM